MTHRSTTQFWVGAWAFAGAIALVACSEDSPLRSCVADADCPGSATCGRVSGQCIDRANESIPLEVSPPSANNQGWVTQEFIASELDARGDVQLKLRAAVSVEGQVFASHDGGRSEPIAAYVSFWRDALISGRPQIKAEAETSEAADDRFQIWLEAGHQYHVYVRPKPPYDTRFPPLKTVLRVDEHLQHDFRVDGEDRAVAVSGQVLNALGKSLPFSVQVRAFKPGSWKRSTIAHTCSAAHPAQCPGGRYVPSAGGNFTLLVPPGIESYTLEIEPAPVSGDSTLLNARTLPFIPAMQCTQRVLGLVEPNQATRQQTMSHALLLPPFAFAQLFSLKVVGDTGSEGQQSAPVSGARVRFSTVLRPPTSASGTDCAAHYVYTAITDPSGKVSLPLLPGTEKNRSYQVMVTSPASSAYASRAIADMQVGAMGGEMQRITLEQRYSLSGKVVDHRGRPIVGAMIEALASTGAVSSQGNTEPARATSTADGQGSFVLHVDPGTYRLNVRPPESSGVPYFRRDGAAILADASDFLLQAPAPRAVVGRVVDASGRGATGFTVNYYQGDQSSELPSGSATLAAQAVTDPDGAFQIILGPTN